MLTRQRGYITLLLYAGAALAVVALLYGAYKWVDTSWETTAGIERGTKTKQAEWDAAVEAQREKEAKQIETATTKHEAQREKTKIVYRTIRQNVERVVTRDVYRDRACFDPDGVRLASDALRGPNGTPGKPDKPMPATDRAPGRPSGDGAPKAD